MVSEAQRRASAKYAKNHVKQVSLKFYPADYELYNFLKSQDGVNAYVKGLIREDMERRNSGHGD